MKVISYVPRGPGFPFRPETLDGNKNGCIYSVMIKMADLTNVEQQRIEDKITGETLLNQ